MKYLDSLKQLEKPARPLIKEKLLSNEVNIQSN